MKNLILLFALSLIAVTLVAQQVDRDKVIIESATGTW